MCGKSFSSAQMMKYHIKAIHNDHKCDICGKSFSQGRYLNRHINAIHNGQNNINNSQACTLKTFSSFNTVYFYYYKIVTKPKQNILHYFYMNQEKLIFLPYIHQKNMKFHTEILTFHYEIHYKIDFFQFKFSILQKILIYWHMIQKNPFIVTILHL